MGVESNKFNKKLDPSQLDIFSENQEVSDKKLEEEKALEEEKNQVVKKYFLINRPERSTLNKKAGEWFLVYKKDGKEQEMPVDEYLSIRKEEEREDDNKLNWYQR